MQISGSLNKKLIQKSVCWRTRDNNLPEKLIGRKKIEFLDRKNIERKLLLSRFHIKFFPFVCIKKYGILQKSDLVFIEKILKKRKIVNIF